MFLSSQVTPPFTGRLFHTKGAINMEDRTPLTEPYALYPTHPVHVTPPTLSTLHHPPNPLYPTHPVHFTPRTLYTLPHPPTHSTLPHPLCTLYPTHPPTLSTLLT